LTNAFRIKLVPLAGVAAGLKALVPASAGTNAAAKLYVYYPTRRAGISTKVAGFDFFPDTQVRPAFAQLK